MKVGRQHEGDALQPAHHGLRLRLPWLRDVHKLVGEVAVQVKVIAVVPSQVALFIPFKENGRKVFKLDLVCCY